MDELKRQIEAGEWAERFEAWDSHWEEVMRLAESYGFILQAYGGVAALATNEVQVEELGAERKARMLRAQGAA